MIYSQEEFEYKNKSLPVKKFPLKRLPPVNVIMGILIHGKAISAFNYGLETNALEITMQLTYLFIRPFDQHFVSHDM